ncbi:PR domain zinc finger protein 5-like [Pararge aegeria]|uniref:PR domain zinc finger protein 5-like n=1 Tax=Pararge aegeria TaxID=116150 RepID=UPI0019D2257D|nr:PR domain zinc finger protein 5-like [Pararge aegeria]
MVYCEINTNQHFEPESQIIDQDPLDGFGDVNEEKFYKLEQSVFAESIQFTKIDFERENGDNADNEFTFLDKVTVEKKIGKRNKYHIELEDDSKPVCPEANCNKKFTSLTLLKAHIRKVHCAVQSHTCELCGARFKAKYLLARHMSVHTRSTIQCPVCSAQLSKRTSLSVHMRFVHRQGALNCDRCDKR